MTFARKSRREGNRTELPDIREVTKVSLAMKFSPNWAKDSEGGKFPDPPLPFKHHPEIK